MIYLFDTLTKRLIQVFPTLDYLFKDSDRVVTLEENPELTAILFGATVEQIEQCNIEFDAGQLNDEEFSEKYPYKPSNLGTIIDTLEVSGKLFILMEYPDETK